MTRHQPVLVRIDNTKGIAPPLTLLPKEFQESKRKQDELHYQTQMLQDLATKTNRNSFRPSFTSPKQTIGSGLTERDIYLYKSWTVTRETVTNPCLLIPGVKFPGFGLGFTGREDYVRDLSR